MRNEYFEKQVKSANVDLEKAKRLAGDHEKLSEKHE